MISIETVFNLVSDLLSKDKGGYMTNDEFNRYSLLAEKALWQFYGSVFEPNRVVPDSMIPFIKESSPLPLSSLGQATIPTDYGHWLQVWYNKTVSGNCGEAPTTTKKLVNYLEKNESGLTIESTLRKPSTSFICWEFRNAKIQVYPETLKPAIVLEYLRYPTYGVRAVTLDATNDQENYDAALTVNYEWREQDQNNLVDLILLQYGIVIRESDVVQFAAQKKSFNNNIIQ